MERNFSKAVDVLNGVLARRVVQPQAKSNYDLDVQAMPVWCLYLFCTSAIQLEKLASELSKAYPHIVPLDLARQIPEYAGEAVGWFSGIFSGVREAELLQGPATWPDGEKESESEAAAELGLEIILMMALCSFFIPMVLRFLWMLLFWGGERHYQQPDHIR